jgi:hypothetical protein
MNDHWLTREATIRRLWIGFAILLLALVVVDLVVHHHSYFGLDGTFGFGAWFGLANGVLLILAAKALGWMLERPDNYYDS